MSKRELPDILTEAEERALLMQFNTRYPTSFRNYCMLELALNTGMRISELIHLKWSDIVIDEGRIHLKKTKGNAHRMLFVKPALIANLLDMERKMGQGPEGLVFTTLKGEPIKDSYLRRMIAEKAKKAGIEGKRVHFHLLRHTYLTRLYSRTRDIRLTQEVAGHADISTTQIYTHISGEDVKQAMLEEIEQ